MAQIHHFKYARSWLTLLLMLPAAALSFGINIAIVYFLMGGQVNVALATISFIALFLAFYVPLRIKTDCKATGQIFHNHALLILNGKEFKVDFSKTTHIARAFHFHGSHWRIDQKDTPSIHLDEPIIPLERKTTRAFMEELKTLSLMNN